MPATCSSAPDSACTADRRRSAVPARADPAHPEARDRFRPGLRPPPLEQAAGGYRAIGTAAAYRNEEAVGRALARSGLPHDELFVTTELWIQDTGEEPARRALETPPAELGPDRCDLCLLHQPYDDCSRYLARPGGRLPAGRGARRRHVRLHPRPAHRPHRVQRDRPGRPPDRDTHLLPADRRRGSDPRARCAHGGVVAAGPRPARPAPGPRPDPDRRSPRQVRRPDGPALADATRGPGGGGADRAGRAAVFSIHSSVRRKTLNRSTFPGTARACFESPACPATPGTHARGVVGIAPIHPVSGRPSALRSHAPAAAGPALQADGATFETRPRSIGCLRHREH
ncbi:aldo/keto reductase [Streptomyces nitrosporeus]|uniref:aldo/keto reductase n=1 Tax=Streptomyces nitrosporeus TaxID=28894 RepID=UPI0039A073E8